MNTKIINVSSKKFEANPGYYLEAADGGARVTIRRGKGLSHVLEARDEDAISPRLKAVIEEGMKDYREGRVTRYTREEIRAKFGL
jgi:hypothetical protein